MKLNTRLLTAALALLVLATGAQAQQTTAAPTPAGAGESAESKDAPEGAAKDAAPKSKPKPKPAAAQQQPKQRKIGGVNLSGSLRLRAEHHGWFAAPGYEDAYTFGAAVLRLSVGQQRERFDWLVEGEFPLLVNLPERAIAPAPQGQLGTGASYFAASGRQDGSAVLKQAFVRAKSVFGDAPSSLRAGRFEFADGTETAPADPTLAALKRDHIAQRLLGNFGWSHVGRSFDAVQYTRSTKSDNLTLVGGRAVEGVFQLRAAKELDVDFWYGAYTRPLAGKTVNGEFRLLGLHYHDGRGALKTDNRAAALRQADTENIRLTTAGGNYIAAVKTGAGTIDLLAWGVGQFGRWGNQTHRAGALVFEGGVQPAGALARAKTWLRAGYARSTGDGDPTDSRHTTFFQVLPTPRIYARLPFYNMMNTEDAYAQVKLRPHARLALRADIHHLRLSNRNDLWYGGGGAFQEGTFGYTGRPSSGRRNLGTLFDVSADLAVTPTTTVTFYGAGVRGGSVQSAIYPAGGANPTARLFYVELMQRF